MLHPILENLKSLRLLGMMKALENQLAQPEVENLSFENRLGLLVDHEIAVRDNRRLQTRLRTATLKQIASMENIDYKHPRGVDKKLLATLANCQWITAHRNILIVGHTGAGKTYLACALAHKACMEGFSSRYIRLPKLFAELAIAKGDGSYIKRLKDLAKIDVVILDDWGLSTINDEQRRDLLEIIDDRHEKGSTIVTSQLPVKLWHEHIGDATLADAILDRLIHNSFKIELKGESMRKLMSNLTQEEK
jgi:DNA replication protein DnaC